MRAELSREKHASVPAAHFYPKAYTPKMEIRIAKSETQRRLDTCAQVPLVKGRGQPRSSGRRHAGEPLESGVIASWPLSELEARLFCLSRLCHREH